MSYTQEQVDEIVEKQREHIAYMTKLEREHDMVLVRLIGSAIEHIDRGDAGSARRVLVSMLEVFK